MLEFHFNIQKINQQNLINLQKIFLPSLKDHLNTKLWYIFNAPQFKEQK